MTSGTGAQDGLTYRSAGVDVEAGEEAVRLIKKDVESTYIPGVLGSLGGFAGMFELPKGLEDPVLVSGTDGVGTKILLAQETGRLNTVGIDLVAMSVNDVLTVGARPLFFLDYVAVGKLVPADMAQLVAGVAEGCRQAGCALIGGEMAEMSGLYAPGEFDLAGFCVALAERKKLIDGSQSQGRRRRPGTGFQRGALQRVFAGAQDPGQERRPLERRASWRDRLGGRCSLDAHAHLRKERAGAAGEGRAHKRHGPRHRRGHSRQPVSRDPGGVVGAPAPGPVAGAARLRGAADPWRHIPGRRCSWPSTWAWASCSCCPKRLPSRRSRSCGRPERSPRWWARSLQGPNGW